MCTAPGLMLTRAGLRLWCRFICLSSIVSVVTFAHAQVSSDGIESAKAKPAYQDKVIEGAPLDDDEQTSTKKYDSTGWSRGYSLETVWDQRNASGQRSSSLGLKANAYIDTPSYGSLSLQATLQQSQDSTDRQSSWVLRQIGMPFDGGLRVDNAVGMVNLPAIDLARSSQRLSLPTPAMEGVTSYWQRTEGLNILAAVGKAGRLGGYPVAGFENSQGLYSLLGVQGQSVPGQWQWGAALGLARDVPSSLAVTLNGQGLLDAKSMYAAARRLWPSADGSSQPDFMQMNAVTGSNTGRDLAGQANPAASGLWADGGFSQGAHQQLWGVFYLQPNLAWLDQPLASDLQGAYWRHSWRTRQWSTEAGLELLGSVSGATAKGFFANHSVRYQMSSQTSLGAAINLRRYGVDAQSLLAYAQFMNPLGNTRVQTEWASARTGERQYKVQLDHDWTQVQFMRLSTSLSVDHDRVIQATGPVTSQGVGLGLSADWSLGNNISVNQSLQARRTSQSSQYSLNAGLSWRFTPQWSLQTSVYATTGATNATALAQSPLVTPATPSSISTRQRDNGIFISIRYQDSAGRGRAPVGGAPGSAAGKLQGSVYLDENKNSQRDASERGAANVTVLLNGRHAVQTDAQGRFEFEWVAAGNHVLTVISDNLPLPWQLDKDGRSEIKIYTRESTTVNIAATKP
jgi:hypothetical protein